MTLHKDIRIIIERDYGPKTYESFERLYALWRPDLSDPLRWPWGFTLKDVQPILLELKRFLKE